MSPSEGVIKFNLLFTPAPPLPPEEVRELSGWRTILRRLQLLGQIPGRYDGFGFGNLSRRLSEEPGDRRFLITGTQTGGIETLGAEGYAVVHECDPGANRVAASGPVRPSAEALTHGTLYAIDPAVRWVMHVHSPEIWGRAAALGIPETSAAAAYGTPELAKEIGSILTDSRLFGLGIICVQGHEDGIFAFGRGAEETGTVILRYLARALMLGS